MSEGARVQQQCRLIKEHRLGHITRARMAHFQLAAAQHMQVTVSLAGVEVVEPAHCAGVMQLSLHPEPFEDAREAADRRGRLHMRSEEHTTELQSLRRISYAGFG